MTVHVPCPLRLSAMRVYSLPGVFASGSAKRYEVKSPQAVSGFLTYLSGAKKDPSNKELFGSEPKKNELICSFCVTDPPRGRPVGGGGIHHTR